jgi:uncharacterized oligopeptide transporter (OPT) family protein
MLRRNFIIENNIVQTIASGINGASSGVEYWNLGELLGWPIYMNGLWYLSLLSIGVGYIAGKGGVAFIIGGYVCYWILAPLLSQFGLFPVEQDTQGQALASMVNGIIGGDVPTQKYLAGAGLGALLSLASPRLGIRVGLGFYLPFSIVLTYGIGTLLRVISDWKLGDAFAEGTGIPIAAGVIVGEALVGVGFAVYMILEAV